MESNYKKSLKNTKYEHNIIDEKMKETLELSILFDFYGELLSENNKKIFTDYIFNDLSLGEIAEEKGISRQGVYDIIRRSSNKLREYEELLHLVKKFQSIKGTVNHMKELIHKMKESQGEKGSSNFKALDEIKVMADDILQQL